MRPVRTAIVAALFLQFLCITVMAEQTAEEYFIEGQRLMSEAFDQIISASVPDMDKAIEAFDKAIELMPGEVRYYTAKAEAQAMQKDPEAALVTLKQAIAVNSDSYEAYTRMAWTLLGLNRPEEAKKANADAISAIDKAITEDPSDIELYQEKAAILLGIVYGLQPEEAKKMQEEALKTMDDAIRIDPTAGMLYQSKSEILANFNRNEDALSVIDVGITKAEDKYGLYLDKVQILRRLDRSKEALEVAESAVSLDPDNAAGYGVMAYIQVLLEMHEEVLATYSRLIELSPENATYYITEKASVLEKLGRYDEAEELYNQVLEQNPDDAQVYSSIGIQLYTAERYEEALVYINKALELKQGDSFAYSTKANILIKLSRPEEATEALCKALELAPYLSYSYKAWREAIDESYQGDETGRLAFYEKSLPLFEGIIEKSPESAYAYIYKWDLLRTLHRDGDAAEVLDKAVAIDAGSAASILANLEYHTEAVAVLDTISDDKEDAGLLYQKAQAYREVNRFDEALAAYDAAAALTANSYYYAEMGDLLAELGRVGEALAAYDGAIKNEHYAVYAYYEKKGQLLADAGRYDEAVVELGEAHSLKEDSQDINIELAFALIKRGNEGDSEYATELLEQVLAGGDNDAKVKALALMGRKEEMIILAADVAGDNTCIAASYRKDPIFEPYRSDPDFIAIVGSDEQ